MVPVSLQRDTGICYKDDPSEDDRKQKHGGSCVLRGASSCSRLDDRPHESITAGDRLAGLESCRTDGAGQAGQKSRQGGGAGRVEASNPEQLSTGAPHHG